MSLKQHTFSAVRWTTVSMVGKSGLQLLQLAILARLLEPSDFGLMALVAAVMAFAHVFMDMGVSNAIIHHQEISHEELSSLYWLNVSAGACLTIFFLILSHPIAVIYNAPALTDLLMVVSVYFLFSSLGQQLRVVAEKDLRFSELARIEIMAAVMGFCVAVTWALLQPVVEAIVAGMLTTILVQTALFWIMLADGWRPLPRLRLTEIRRFLGFGGYMMANNLINSINAQADILIGGRVLPASALGVYSLPRSLSLKVAGTLNPVVTRVGLPVMAKVQQDRKKLKHVYLQTLRMTASVNFPIYLALAAFSPEVIALLFGEKWADAAPVLSLLALWGMGRSIGNPVGSLLLAVGRADLSFKWNLALFFIIPPSLWIGSQWGMMGLAATQVGLIVVLFVPGWYFLIRPLCDIGLYEYLVNLAYPMAASLLAVMLAFVSVHWVSTPVWRLLDAAVIGIVAYLLVSLWLNQQWIDSMKELVQGKIDER